EILAVGYPITPDLRPIPVGPEQQERVKDMTIHFLLKWNNTLHREAQFYMMRAFRQRVALEGLAPDPLRIERLARLDEQLRVPGWWAFRLKRKLKHISG
ncbi:MAG TPA: hypothetical protein VHL57_04655, partial [Flavobacteriales bacterium]|nr:hypothetical protein [Flavobacteriales bacterium]